MKKFLSVLLALVLVFAAISLVACDKKDSDSSAESGTGGADTMKTTAYEFKHYIIEVPDELVHTSENGGEQEFFMNLSTGSGLMVTLYQGVITNAEETENMMQQYANNAVKDMASSNDDPLSETVISDIKLVSVSDNYYKITFVGSKNNITLYGTLCGYLDIYTDMEHVIRYKYVTWQMMENESSCPYAAAVNLVIKTTK